MFAALCVSKWVATGVFPLRVYDLFFNLRLCGKCVFPSGSSPHSTGWVLRLTRVGGHFGVVSFVPQIIFVPQVSGRSDLVWAGEISYSVYLVHAHVLRFSHIF